MTGTGDDNGGKKNGDASGTKTSSSYFLSSNDNPRNLITHVQLKGENYEEWSRAIRTALRAKKKLVFIDGTMKKPNDESPDLEDWWIVNSMLVAWMFNTIEPTLCSTITHMENAKDIWDEIKQCFCIGNGPRVQQLKADLADCKQRGQSIISYYGRLKMLWGELENYDQIPTYKLLLDLRQKIALLLVSSVTEQVTLQKVASRSLVIKNGRVIDLRRPDAELEKVEEDLKVLAIEVEDETWVLGLMLHKCHILV
ncbi:retrovirus-related pol polyprotein from transposon TNT 1-94 [Tanacetum coccineum]